MNTFAATRLARLALALAVLAPAIASAGPRMTISIAQLREVAEQKDGVRTTRMVPASSVSPGEIVEYVLTYANQGDAPALDANVENAVPKGTTYLAGTASGDGAEITFSADGGKTFSPAVKLTYEIRLPSGAVEKRIATPDEYTHVRWTLKRVAPGATGKVAFRVKVK